MNSNVEFIIDRIFTLDDQMAINTAGQQLTDLITGNQVSSRFALELIKRKIVGGTARVIERGICILNFMVCSSEEQFKIPILSLSCLNLFEEISKIPYTRIKQQALENLSVWLALYSTTDISADQEKIFSELEKLLHREQRLEVPTSSNNDDGLGDLMDLVTITNHSDESTNETFLNRLHDEFISDTSGPSYSNRPSLPDVTMRGRLSTSTLRMQNNAFCVPTLTQNSSTNICYGRNSFHYSVPMSPESLRLSSYEHFPNRYSQVVSRSYSDRRHLDRRPIVRKCSTNQSFKIHTAATSPKSMVTETKLKSQEDPIETNMCIVCMAQSKSYACIPCGHKIVCSKCYTISKNKFSKCPVCRQNVDKIYQIFE